MSSNQHSVLVIDQELSTVRSLQDGWSLDVANQSLENTLDYLKTEKPDLVVFNYSEPVSSTLQQICDTFPDQRVIALGKDASASDAVKALKLGSVEFVAKDIKAPELKAIIWKLLEDPLNKSCVINSPWFYGHSEELKVLLSRVAAVGRKQNIILVGPSGCGKQKVAEIINDTFSPKHKQIVTINLATFPDESRETFFWGTLRDLFKKYDTAVNGVAESLYGTVYIQGLEACSPDFCKQLFEMFYDREHSNVIGSGIRIVVGLNAEPEFSSYRELTSRFFTIKVPSLAQRSSDIPEIAQALVIKYANLHARLADGASFEVLNILLKYQWPGNLRELDLLVENMVLRSTGKEIELVNMPVTLAMLGDAAATQSFPAILPLASMTEIFKKALFKFSMFNYGKEKTDVFFGKTRVNQ